MQCVLIMFRHPCYAPALPCAHHISSQRQALRLYLVIVISCIYSVLPICAWVWDHYSGCCDPKGEYLSPSVTIHCLQFLPEEWSHLVVRISAGRILCRSLQMLWLMCEAGRQPCHTQNSAFCSTPAPIHRLLHSFCTLFRVVPCDLVGRG